MGFDVDASGRATHKYQPTGGAWDFWNCHDVEVLCESGAGTGKTRSLLEKALSIALEFPESRQFFARKTHKDLADTVLPEWESHVLGRGHPAISGSARPSHRQQYEFPNGSTIDLFGLQDVDSRMSGQWHRGYVFECHEAMLEDWEKLLTRLRAIPVFSIVTGRPISYQLVADTNPSRKTHWLNERAEQPYSIPDELKSLLPPARPGQKRMTRICYRHEDNPRLYDFNAGKWTPFGAWYLGINLGALTGARRERLLFHRWVSEEGLVWPEFDRGIHVVDATIVIDRETKPDAHWIVVPSWGSTPTTPWKARVARYIGGLDWGTTAAGCLVIAAVTEARQKFIVRELYFRHRSLDWWAAACVQAQDDYGLDLIAADPARPECIEQVNMRMGTRRARDGAMIVRGANNKRNSGLGTRDLGGLDAVRMALRPPASNGSPSSARPNLVWLRDRFSEGVDKVTRDELRLPWCSTEEIEDYLWSPKDDGDPSKDVTDPKAEDHGCDAVRYLCTAEWEIGQFKVPSPKEIEYQPGQVGFIFPPPWKREAAKRRQKSPFAPRD